MGNFQTRLTDLITEFAAGKHTVFAKRCGIKPSTFQYYVNGRMPNAESLIRICETYNVSITWILTGKGCKYLNEVVTPKDKTSEIIEIQHGNLIRKFRDKERAKNINLNLVTIERLNPNAFKEIDIYIKGVVSGLEFATKDGAGEWEAVKNGTADRKKKAATGTNGEPS
ncbi:MAG: helix-turn-helix transcriptional regulator [Deltaproteobacteria bacterium]|nr:helix-turn-helix transcriptional regulator [Deltaproteobacteria bacterium]